MQLKMWCEKIASPAGEVGKEEDVSEDEQGHFQTTYFPVEFKALPDVWASEIRQNDIPLSACSIYLLPCFQIAYSGKIYQLLKLWAPGSIPYVWNVLHAPSLLANIVSEIPRFLLTRIFIWTEKRKMAHWSEECGFDEGPCAMFLRPRKLVVWCVVIICIIVRMCFFLEKHKRIHD